MSSTRRALLFAPYFLPRRRVGSMRPFRFAIHLREFGWEPVVLTIAAPGQRMTSKEARLLQGVEIIEIRSPFDRTVRSESQLGAEQTRNVPGRTAPTNQRTSVRRGIADSLLKTIDRQFPTDTWLLLFAAKYRELHRIVRAVQPDVLWATGDPWSGLVAASRLANHFSIPWVADFRDPWTLSEIRSEGKWGLSRRADAYFERKIIASADVVMFQAGSVEAAYRKHFGLEARRTRLVTNSFDSSVFDDPITFATAPPVAVSESDGLHIGFFGRFRSMSPAMLIIDALGAARRKDPIAAERIHIHSFGSLNEEDAEYAQKHGVASNFVRDEAVPLEQALSVLRRFDLLLVSTDVSRDQIIPAKLLEYIVAARPILSLSLNGEVAEILETTGTGVQLDPRQSDIVADLLLACLRASDEGSPLPLPFQPNAKAIGKYEAVETTRMLAGVFDEITWKQT